MGGLIMKKNFKHNVAQVAAPSNLSQSRTDRFLAVSGWEISDARATEHPLPALTVQAEQRAKAVEWKREKEWREWKTVRMRGILICVLFVCVCGGGSAYMVQCICQKRCVCVCVSEGVCVSWDVCVSEGMSGWELTRHHCAYENNMLRGPSFHVSGTC